MKTKLNYEVHYMSETVPFNMLDVGNIKFYEADFTRLDMNGIIKDTSNTTWFSSFNDFWKLMENQKFVLEAITGEPIPDKEEIGNTAHEMPVDYARKLAQSVRLNGEPYPVAPESINELNSRNVVRDIVYRLWYNTKGKTHPDGTIISAEKYETKEPIFVEYTEPYLYVVPDVSPFKRFMNKHFGFFKGTMRNYNEVVAKNNEILDQWATLSEFSKKSFNLINNKTSETATGSTRTLTNADEVMKEAGMHTVQQVVEMPSRTNDLSAQLDNENKTLPAPSKAKK